MTKSTLKQVQGDVWVLRSFGLSGATEPDGVGRVRLRYEFNVIPAPLARLFRVYLFGPLASSRTSSIAPLASGALLHYGPASAKVWATQGERWVYATISAGRDRFV